MPPKNNTLINNQYAVCNIVQNGSNDEAKSLKIVIAKKTQNTPTDSTDWIIKTGKRSTSLGNSPTSKVNNKNHNKFTYSTLNRYEALKVMQEDTYNEKYVKNG
jgi:hypothetical protein